MARTLLDWQFFVITLLASWSAFHLANYNWQFRNIFHYFQNFQNIKKKSKQFNIFPKISKTTEIKEATASFPMNSIIENMTSTVQANIASKNEFVIKQCVESNDFHIWK